MTPWAALSGFLHRRWGMWQYLAVRTASKTALSLERERNAATAAVVRSLPPGSELLECERGGRMRWIRIPPAECAPGTARKHEQARIAPSSQR
jgi:hypothetical protein